MLLDSQCQVSLHNGRLDPAGAAQTSMKTRNKMTFLIKENDWLTRSQDNQISQDIKFYNDYNPNGTDADHHLKFQQAWQNLTQFRKVNRPSDRISIDSTDAALSRIPMPKFKHSHQATEPADKPILRE